MSEHASQWWQMMNALRQAAGDEPVRLLDQCRVKFDDLIRINAEPEIYARLVPYYPLIENMADEVCNLRVDLQSVRDVPMGTDDSVIQLEMGYADVAEAIIRPESIVSIPSYMLRFVPFFGASALLVATALRQVAYRKHLISSARLLSRGDQITVDVQSLLNLLGGVISRAKFFRILKDGKLDWFACRADPEHSFEDGRIRRMANTYLYQGQRLTPGDAHDLFTWLMANAINTDALAALKLAAKTNRNQILSFPYRTPEAGDEAFYGVQTVHEVVKLALGSKSLDPELASACDLLMSHLIRPESFLAVPWYWFSQVLPELGDDLGVLYLMCKNCCYVDWAHGNDRNVFWVEGGAKTLQTWINSASLPERIPQKEGTTRGRKRAQDVNDNAAYMRNWRDETRQMIGQYLCRVDSRPSANGTDWQLEVNDTHLTQADETLQSALYRFLQDSQRQGLHATLAQTLAAPNQLNLLRKALAILDQGGFCNYETLVSKGICNFDTLSSAEIRNFDTLLACLICNFDTQVRDSICKFDTVLNILMQLKNTFLSHKHTQQPYTAVKTAENSGNSGGAGGYFDQNGWNMMIILRRIPDQARTEALNTLKTPQILSWLIYGSLTESIKSPLNYALARASETKMDAGGAFTRLAGLNPAQLAEGLQGLMQRVLRHQTCNIKFDQNIPADLKTLLNDIEPTQQIKLFQRLMDILGIPFPTDQPEQEEGIWQ